MYRAKTVRELQRTHERERDLLLRIISDQNDRIAFLAGRPVPPVSQSWPRVHDREDPDADLVFDVDQVEE